MQMKIEQARMVFRNGGCSRHRAENISRLTFEYVHRMTAGQQLAAGRRVERVEAPSVRLALGAMSDREVARAAAREVFRAIISAATIGTGS
jgi:hypothetical protein